MVLLTIAFKPNLKIKPRKNGAKQKEREQAEGQKAMVKHNGHRGASQQPLH